MDENPQVEEVLKIARADQRRRADAEAQSTWAAEFNFWHKFISEEVERLRFNEGYEPVRIDLYPASQGPIAFLGETQVGHIKFAAVGRWGSDSSGQKVLRITILKAK